jgi:hypothetical protein
MCGRFANPNSNRVLLWAQQLTRPCTGRLTSSSAGEGQQRYASSPAALDRKGNKKSQAVRQVISRPTQNKFLPSVEGNARNLPFAVVLACATGPSVCFLG